ncbi:hypothetical protein J2B92_19495 [Lysinibacillus sphaericus]|uniref:hypothetical protein n=1 Tax=Lysinibacillus sphaericus TaxID=1421 RepID=UPI0018CEB718|nr:hypothetical protein [Lysinibacillus sphaericus]MBG9757303.1 hypothetical protein [Lysinibacillus sphaericus]QTB12953.1 hypothetical protein J2B92_19495 [Lysinibacillus sphaericus]
MEFIEFNKKKQNVISFVLYFLTLFTFIFLFAFIICFRVHIKYQGEYLTSILWAVFLFIMPALISFIVIMIVYYYIFQKFYMPKKVFVDLKEIASYLSVFTLIIINSLVKFYVPSDDVSVSKSLIINEVEEFFKITIKDINYTYTVPIFFSVTTIVMYVFEKWKHATGSKFIKKINTAKRDINIPNPNIKKLEQILDEMRNNLNEAKQILNKIE